MKKLKIYSYIAALLLLGVSCDQELVDNSSGPCPSDDPSIICPQAEEAACPEGVTAGSASFAKFVAVGNSFVAGFQAGAVFNESQVNSLPKILATQFKCAGGPEAFNQPDINSVNGYNLQLSTPSFALGRMVLFDPDGTVGPRTPLPFPARFPGSVVTCPAPTVTTPPLPDPYNTADVPTAFTGNKAALNNFGVPLIYLGQAGLGQTGGPASANPYYNPLYARFATNPGTSTILGDALAAAGSFYLIWLGFDDVLLYAATGADGSRPMTTETDFNNQFNSILTTMLNANPVFKGVVGNIPDFKSLPYFYTVAWNAIPLDAAKAETLTTSLANNYNAFLEGMVANSIITADERNRRRLTYVAGNNGILLTDEDLTDLSTYMTGPYAGLAPYAKARQATATDLVPLTAGSVLGTCNGGNENAVFGVSYPVSDTYILTPAETTVILTRTAAFNTIINNAVTASSRLALANVNKGYSDFVTAKAAVANGVSITPSFAPPSGAFSADGLHPNSRGYAFTANIFIDAINAKFGATIPKANLAKYSATPLPVNP